MANLAASKTFRVRSSLSGFVCDQLVTLQPGEDVLLGCDFKDVLSPGETLSGVTSVTDEASESPAITISGEGVDNDKHTATWRVTNITDGLQYRLEVIVTTTNSNTLIADCRVNGEATP